MITSMVTFIMSGIKSEDLSSDFYTLPPGHWTCSFVCISTPRKAYSPAALYMRLCDDLYDDLYDKLYDDLSDDLYDDDLYVLGCSAHPC